MYSASTSSRTDVFLVNAHTTNTVLKVHSHWRNTKVALRTCRLLESVTDSVTDSHGKAATSK